MIDQKWIDAERAWEQALWNASEYADRDNSGENEDDEESEGEDGE